MGEGGRVKREGEGGRGKEEEGERNSSGMRLLIVSRRGK